VTLLLPTDTARNFVFMSLSARGLAIGGFDTDGAVDVFISVH
jgi:hypothetical protein